MHVHIKSFLLWLVVFLFACAAPVSAEIIVVPGGGNLQFAIDKAVGGDHIVLSAGLTYQGQFKFPAKTGVVTLRSSGTLPDRRVTPADLPLMATIRSGVSAMALDFYDSTNWEVDGIAFKTNTGGFGEVIGIWRGDKITLRRTLIQTAPGEQQKRFILANGTNITWTQSWCGDIYRTGQDSQCFASWDGAGPYKIIDNHISAASENVLFGGADPSSYNNIPADILIERNLFTKPLAWKGVANTYQVKNLLEFKAARRAIVRNNTFENNWADAQSGRSILITPRNQDGTSPWVVTEDILIENNVLRNMAMGFNISGYDDANPSGQTKNIIIRSNRIEVQGMAFLLHNENGRIEIYNNLMVMPSDQVLLSFDKGTAWPTGQPKRNAFYAVHYLVFANNPAPGTYIHSSDVVGEGAFKAHTVDYSLSTPVAPSDPPPPVEDPVKPPPPLALQVEAQIQAKSCGLTVKATPPDTTGGWRAQFKRGTTNIGVADVSAPFTRSTTVTPGNYVLSVTWTKTGQVTRTSELLTVQCK